MDNLEYLNQISVKPKAPASSPSLLPALNKKVIFIILGVLVGLALIAILISAFSSSAPSEPAELSPLRALYLHFDNLSAPLDSYTNQVKSPVLRSSGRTLAVTLSNSKTALASLLESEYGVASKDLKLDASTSAELETFKNSLENARLNGILDRTYANELSYQISVLLIYESSALEKTSSENVKSFLKTSSASLETLKEDFSK